MNNTPDYTNNLAFAPGDWSDSRVTGNTDRTVTTIRLIEKIEELQKKHDMAMNMLTTVYLTLQQKNTFPEVRGDIKDLLITLKKKKKEKYITFHTGKWTFQYRGKYLGRYKTLDEAVAARDEYIRSKL